MEREHLDTIEEVYNLLGELLDNWDDRQDMTNFSEDEVKILYEELEEIQRELEA